MTTPAFIVVTVVCIGVPLLYVLMWAKLAKSIEIGTAELLRYPSLRRYFKYDLAVSGLAMTGVTLAVFVSHIAASAAGVLMLVVAGMLTFRGEKLRKAEIRRLQESQGESGE